MTDTVDTRTYWTATPNRIHGKADVKWSANDKNGLDASFGFVVDGIPKDAADYFVEKLNEREALAAERGAHEVTIENLASDVVTLEARCDELERLADGAKPFLQRLQKADQYDREYLLVEWRDGDEIQLEDLMNALTAYQRKQGKEA